MIIPAAMMIESALDQLGDRGVGGISDEIRDMQGKELNFAMGAPAAAALGVTFPLSPDFFLGYMLGLQTARVMMRMNVKMMLAKIDPENVL